MSETHLGPEDLYDHVENRLSARKLREVEAHLAQCSDCVESLAMLLRAERPASREEEGELARAIPSSPAARVAELRDAIERSRPARARGAAIEWKPLLVALALLLVVTTSGLFVYSRYWLPAQSRRIAAETLSALVELRQATGRIPLRYITQLERASVTRSAFDDTGETEEQLERNLRRAVERAPEPEALLTLGLLLLDDGQLDEAQDLFERVLELEPRSVGALNGLAVIDYVRADRGAGDSYAMLQRGLARLREAQAADPDDLRPLYNLGKFYEALGMKSAEIQAWARYLKRDPSSRWGEEAAYELRQLQPR